ncbi:hypothetical protein V8F06_001941 [Rhypophila decipiens]
MLEGRLSLLCLLFLGSVTCLITSVSALERLVNKRSSVINARPDSPDSVRLWPAQPRPSAVGEDTALPPTTPTISSNMTPTLKYSQAPTMTSRPSVLGRRTFVDNNNALVISSLNSALASATASALSMSESMAKEFASSLGELQASASSALAAASSAVLAAEVSAGQAVFRVEESAARMISVATRVATDGLPEQTTRTQAQLELEAAEGAAMSITRAAVAIVVSIVVSAICSILGFYLFLRYRRARRKREREDGRQTDQAETAEPRSKEQSAEQRELGPREQERDWSATEALARAVVSYIEKEQMPTPVTPPASSSPVHPTGPLSPHLHPPPTPFTPMTPGTPARSPFPPSPMTPVTPGNLLLPTRYSIPKPGKKEPPSPVSAAAPASGKIGFAVGGEVDDPLWVSQHPPPSHPPPPTPLRYAHSHRKISSESTVRSHHQGRRRTMSNPNRPPQLPELALLPREPDEQSPPQDSDRSIYGEIITHPLEPVATSESRISRPASVAGDTLEIHPPERSKKRDSNWPLPKDRWL